LNPPAESFTILLLRLILSCKSSVPWLDMAHSLPISALRRGEVADVVQLVGSPEHIRRMEELGLREGARLEVICAGSPCIVRVGGATLCFREEEMLRLFVTPRKTA
jgi:Fe2+ transport system protein FeoA